MFRLITKIGQEWFSLSLSNNKIDSLSSDTDATVYDSECHLLYLGLHSPVQESVAETSVSS